MTPRPFHPDPTCWVVFGRSSLPGREGEVPKGARPYFINPPTSKAGVTLFRAKHGRTFYQKLRRTDFISQQEAAAFLRVRRMQVNRWVRSGKLVDRKILGTSRIKVGTLIRFLRATGRLKLVPFLTG